MRYVYEIYRQKSFSKAAQALFITQPALSIAIGKLEASLGMPLFDRSTRPISLTPAGRIYLQTIEQTSIGSSRKSSSTCSRGAPTPWRACSSSARST